MDNRLKVLRKNFVLWFIYFRQCQHNMSNVVRNATVIKSSCLIGTNRIYPVELILATRTSFEGYLTLGLCFLYQ